MTETANVRPGEELDTRALSEYLHSQLSDSKGEIEISQFPAGSSNLTYLIRIGAEEFVLRRPPFGNQVKTAHDMNREFQSFQNYPKSIRPRQSLCFFAPTKMLPARSFI
jgi:aminoglycoside phosphotransferase (APT) family kinase protein